MRYFLFCAPLFALTAAAETHSLTLQQTLELAARQNPDVTIARLDQQHSDAGIRVAQDPFRPKVVLGSGAAYTYGYPNGDGDCNCTTWFERLGLPLLTGRMDEFTAVAGVAGQTRRRFGP